MTIQPSAVRPDSREDWLSTRRRFVGASEIAALFGCHPYMSAYELWARKTGRLPEVAETPAMFWGSLLEDDVLTAVARQKPEWSITPTVIPGGVIITDEANRLAATPDAFATDPERGRGIIQVKTTNPRTFARAWHDAEDHVEVPLWIALQANLEAHLARVPWADVAVFVIGDYGGHRVEVLNVPLEPEMIPKAEAAARRFVDMVETDTPPDPDFGRDLDLIKRLARDTPSITDALDLTGDNEFTAALAAFVSVGRDIKALQELRESHEARIRHSIGPHEACRAGGFSISNKLTSKAGYTVAPTSFRTLRVTERKH